MNDTQAPSDLLATETRQQTAKKAIVRGCGWAPPTGLHSRVSVYVVLYILGCLNVV